jgi:wyosine [tRNA(Phe)-imidazoG37] synthetase (radical SAM superfamily)
MRTLDLKQGVIYGPINSRRLGSSLGINLSPTEYKLCTFNCLYCHYGWTKELTGDISAYRGDLPSVEQVRESLEDRLKGGQGRISYITFSGNGEPAMHPDFDRMVEMALTTKNKYVPRAKLAILSNSTCLGNAEVRRALKKLDVRIMKLDCGSEETFRKINHPCTGVRLEQVVEGLKELDDIIVQTVFVQGRVSNADDPEAEKWMGRLSYIKPKEVQIYSIDRPSADHQLALVTKDRLSEIAETAEKSCGIPVKVF